LREENGPCCFHRTFLTLQGPTGIVDYATTYISTFGYDRLALFVLGSRDKRLVVGDPSVSFPGAIARLWPDPPPFHWPPEDAISDDFAIRLGKGEDIFPTPVEKWPPE
jgi:hypothetical protein